MLRKIVSLLVILTLPSSLFISCRGYMPSAVSQHDSTSLKESLQKPLEKGDMGNIHNDVIREFTKMIPQIAPGQVDREEFIDIFLKASNKVLKDHHVNDKLDKVRIDSLLDWVDQLRSDGIFDFFSKHSQDHLSLLNHLSEIGELGKEEAANIEKLIGLLMTTDFPPKRDFDRPSLVSAASGDNFHPIVLMAAQVADSSFALWSELYQESFGSGQNDEQQKIIDWWTIHVILADLYGAVIGLLYSGGLLSAILAAFFSILFVMATG